MKTFKGLEIPKSHKQLEMLNKIDIAENFCKSVGGQCENLDCNNCLYGIDNKPIFDKWYRRRLEKLERILKYDI